MNNMTGSCGGPGTTRHLADIANRCVDMGMCVIYVNAAERDFWLSASLPCAEALDGKARVSQSVLRGGGRDDSPAENAGARTGITTQQSRLQETKHG